ncbi:cytochrome c-type biogenesis protein CcmH [Kineobactrum sediminis]|uniref:Cytochrome c-type biogenesis protein n=1 Tax=Kineobactrum sediminis TaxID=1905677 RepID=A0A2N5Y4D6_9GAMM|nr:cytochrome c-type biogenesis protein [Kineobactrum sediminis]PLW83261.1 cytochrome c-type biogenesis protein CcmH [Kineobactrum sediminis]
MKLIRLCGLALFTLLLALPATAVIETYEFSDRELELRYRELSQELRCPKCQNQNIADSNAPISQDLRRLLHQQLEAGATDAEILNFMVARYGEFVRYRPSFNGVAVLLWLAPILLLLIGVASVLLMMRGRRQQSTALDPAEQQELSALLATTEKDD